MSPNGLAHLPPIIARQLTLKITFSTKWPLRTHAEGGQVEPVLGSVTIFLYSLRTSSSNVGLWKNSIHGFIISTDM